MNDTNKTGGYKIRLFCKAYKIPQKITEYFGVVERLGSNSVQFSLVLWGFLILYEIVELRFSNFFLFFCLFVFVVVFVFCGVFCSFLLQENCLKP